jgi:5-methylcytosine-specific restriction endonuclease McrA
LEKVLADELGIDALRLTLNLRGRTYFQTWHCYLCGRPLTIETLTLDHVKSRSRHPELRYELSNLRPACWACNTAKSSRDITELGSGHTPLAPAA